MVDMSTSGTSGNGAGVGAGVGAEITRAGNGNSGLFSGAKALLQSFSSALVERYNFARNFGFQSYNGARNLFLSLGYPEQLTLNDFRGRYRRGGIAKRIIEYLPKETWAGGIAVIENPDPDIITEFETQISDLFTRLSAISKLQRADILAGIGWYSCILIGIKSSNPSDIDLATPLPRFSSSIQSSDALVYFTPLPEDCAVIETFIQDPSDPRFGLPEYYTISVGTNPTRYNGSGRIGTSLLSSRRVHWTRVIHIAHDILESDIYGQPVLESVWNHLDDLYKIVGGVAEAAWRRMDPGLHVDIDPNFQPAPGTEEGLSDQIDEYQNNLSRTLKTSGVTVTPLSANISYPVGSVDSILDLIAATRSMQKRILLGSERGELASTQDRKNKQDFISSWRFTEAEPVLRTLIDRLIDHGYLIKPADGKYEILWPEEDELSESEKAEVAGKFATANASQKNAEGKLIITSDEIRDSLLGKKPLPEPKELPSPMNDPAVPDPNAESANVNPNANENTNA